MNPIQKQRGAVLAFSLVMLLLLTLVSTSMIQQNKTQISVAANTGQQTKTFAEVETALRRTQAVLEPLRYSDKVATHCRSGQTYSVDQGDTLDLSDSSITATVSAVHCVSNYDAYAGGGDERQCFYLSGSRDAMPWSDASTTPNQAACDRLNKAGWKGVGVENPDYCQIEIYTLHVTLEDQSSGSKRTVESKFQIDCSGDRYG